MKQCNQCGKINSDNSAFCTSCGAPLSTSTQPGQQSPATPTSAQQQLYQQVPPQQSQYQQEPTQQQSYQQVPPQQIPYQQPSQQAPKNTMSNAVVIIALVLFFPIGLYFMWAKTNWNRNVKIAVTVVIAVLALFGMFSNKSTDTKTPVDDITTSSVSQEEISQTTTETTTESTTQETTISEEVTEKSSVYYSTNGQETAKEGNAGVYAYIGDGQEYDVYWIIDFDEGYVYNYFEGNGDEECSRAKIKSGTLNDTVTATWDYDGVISDEYYHFKVKRVPTTLVQVDYTGMPLEFTATDLSDALKIREKKTIVDR